MSASATVDSAMPAIDQLHARFQMLIPRIELHATIVFRHVKCLDQKQDFVNETIALAWKWYLRLAERGKDAANFVRAFVTFAARSVRSGRRACGQESATDVLSPLAQRRHDFAIEPLPSSHRTSHEDLYSTPFGQRMQDAMEECLHENIVTPIPDQVQFRLDFPSWLETLTGRERRLIREMVRDERTKDLSRRFELSPGRISQIRRELHDDWERFTGEEIGGRQPALNEA